MLRPEATTFSTNFPPLVDRLRLASKNGGFTHYNGQLVKIVAFHEMPEQEGVSVDFVHVEHVDNILNVGVAQTNDRQSL